MKKLTPKQETFLNYILEGKSQAEAYKQAYPNATNPETIRANASKLFKSEPLQHYYRKAMEDLRAKSLYNKERAIEDLLLLIDIAKDDLQSNGIKQANVLAITKATEQLIGLLMISATEEARIELDKEKLELAKSKIQSDNDGLQKENASLLRQLVTNARAK